MGEDGGSPFDGVDFCHEGAIHEAGFVEDLVAAPSWVSGTDSIADGVVFHCEKGVKHFHSDPPIVVEACGGVSVGVSREELGAAVIGEEEFAIVEHISEGSGCSFAGAVDLGAVPPCCVGVSVSWTVDIGLV